MSQQPQGTPSSWDLSAGAGNSFPFDQIGASVTGYVEMLEEVQQTDMDTGEPVFWPSGQPKMMFRVGLADTNAPRDPNNPGDDGRRNIYLRGSRKAETKSSLSAVLGAVQAATGSANLQPGGRLTLTYVGDGVPASRGKNAPKLYEAQYAPPAMNLAGQQQPAQPAYQQPAPPANGYAPAQAPAQQPYQQPQPAPQYQPAPAPQYQPQQPAPAQPAAPQQYQPAPAQPPAAAYPQQAPAPAVPGLDPQQAAALTPEQLAALRAAGVAV